MPKVSIIILNYNNWQDTIECLESIVLLIYENFNVIIVDNKSSNDSVENLINWLQIKSSNVSMQFSFNKKVCSNFLIEKKEYILIQSNENNGYASGNNTGISYAMKIYNPDYYWIINNDTVVSSDSLSNLVSYSFVNKKSKLGIIGSKLIYYYNQNFIQGIGGKYNIWTGKSKHIGDGLPVINKEIDNYNLNKIDYVIGAALFTSKLFIKDIGLLNEKYFLYFEEIDWVLRGNLKGYGIGYCPSSIILHKEGGSTKTSLVDKYPSLLSDLNIIKSRIIFTKKYYSYTLPLELLFFVVTIFNRIRRRQFDRIYPLTHIFIKMIFCSK